MFSRLAATSIALAFAPSIAFAQGASPSFLQENRLAIAVLIFVYILPSWIAWSRKHGSKGSIIAVNILLGWTGIGWLVAFIWSLGSTGKAIVVVNPSPIAATSQNASTTIPVASKTVAERITELKAMLDSGTISQAEFDLLKADAMKGLS